MFEPHAVTESPDRGQSLWRFLDFTKYVSMLDHGALYFTRSDQFTDPFEGLLWRRPPVSEDPDELRRRVFVSSWHMNDHESAAMWRIYLKSDEGVAIQTSYQRLVDSFRGAPEAIHVGIVHYLDHRHDDVPAHHDLARFLCKRKSFEYESEVRALWRSDEALREHGRYLCADLSVLLERVVVSPSAEPWFGDLVRSVTARYGVDVRVERSALADPPPGAT